MDFTHYVVELKTFSKHMYVTKQHSNRHPNHFVETQVDAMKHLDTFIIFLLLLVQQAKSIIQHDGARGNFRGSAMTPISDEGKTDGKISRRQKK